MITYTYVVKCPNCDEEFFDFFDEAKAFALGCLSQKPIITQTEVNRNDFGECTDHCDLGTVWSWEDAVGKETDVEPASVFTKDDFKDYIPDEDPEFQDDGAIEGFLTEAKQKLATNSKGDYLVRASSGLGYTVFNRSNVAIGGFEEDDDNTAITRFRRGNITEDFDDFDIGPQIDEFIPPEFEDNSFNLKTWVCYYDGNAVGTVEAETEEEAMREFEDQYNDELVFDSWDHDWSVEEQVEESCNRKPVPEGMTIAQLKEAMEENEDTVECVGCEELFPKDECVHKDGMGWLCGDCKDSVVKCTWCEELFDRSECRMEVDLGWLCDRCEAGIKSRGETLTFREGSYWDFLDEEN